MVLSFSFPCTQEKDPVFTIILMHTLRNCKLICCTNLVQAPTPLPTPIHVFSQTHAKVSHLFLLTVNQYALFFLFVSELPCTLLLEKAMNTPCYVLLSKEQMLISKIMKGYVASYPGSSPVLQGRSLGGAWI